MKRKEHRRNASEQHSAKSARTQIVGRTMRVHALGRRICGFEPGCANSPQSLLLTSCLAMPTAQQRSSLKQFQTRGRLVDLVAAGANKLVVLVEQLRSHLRRLLPFLFCTSLNSHTGKWLSRHHHGRRSRKSKSGNTICRRLGDRDREPLPVSWAVGESIRLPIKNLRP
jgi:hypothetical protein